MATVPAWVQSIPKAELHVHLEGSFRPRATAQEIRERYAFHDFTGFIEAFKWTVSFLRKPEHYARAARKLTESLISQRVTYAEITLSAGVVLWKDLPLDEVYDAVRRETSQAAIPIRWILDCIRQHGGEPALQIADFVRKNRTNGVVGFGIGGNERTFRASEFRHAVAHAGVPIVPHAGEITDADNIWDVLAFNPRRIGHGIRAVDDPQLMDTLRERNIPLEICLTSNVRTGAVPSLAAHPIRRLFDAGVPLLLGSDDPAIFGTTLVREYKAAASLGFSQTELKSLAENSLRYSIGERRDVSEPRA